MFLTHDIITLKKRKSRMNQLFTLLLIVSTLLFRTHGFTPHFAIAKRTAPPQRLSPLSFSASALPEVEKMKASELRKELQSYGIATKTFFEKTELIEAVNNARAEGKKPITDRSPDEGTSTGSSSSKSREERIADEIEKCKQISVGELKKELQSYGVDIKSFFEKSEFVGAVAEARVDGKKKKAQKSTGGSRVEEYDPSYRDVVMQKMNVGAKSLMGNERVIDIQLGR
mmetsp:Transcript_4486/g.8615  ORF Transcript_4486/g.8615 Transcript_4486/m.8615 type:complete len:228 (-) Transcript_4486:1672-2355(-)